MKKKLLFLLSLCFFTLSGYAQDATESFEIEQQLCLERKAYLDVAFDFDRNAQLLANRFKSHLQTVLKTPASFDYPFDSLAKQVGILSSPDGLFKIFSWEHMIGGTWHDIYSIAQFKTDQGVYTQQLNTEQEGATGDFTDSYYYDIQILNQGSQQIYLLFGSGSHGSGHHHKIIRAFVWENQQFQELPTLFNGERYLAVEAARMDKIELRYDAERKKIVYNEFKMQRNSGFKESTGKTIALCWDGTSFTLDNRKK